MRVSQARREYLELPIGLIEPPELAARATMDEEKLEELTRDIARKGVLQPLIVARVGERYEVIAGHRRRLAAERAGLIAVPCIVYPSKDAALEGVKYSENRFREELNPADEALLFAELLERDCGGDVDRLCEQLGEKRSYVEGRLLLFSGDRAVFDALQAGKIAIGVAHQLNRCTEEQYRRYLLHQAILGGATVAVVSGWIQDWQAHAHAGTAAPPESGVSAAPAPVAQSNFFRCYVCGGEDNVHLMQPINVHSHCQLAILDKLVAAYRGEDPQDGTGRDPRRT